MRIKKVSQTTTTQAQIVDGYSESKIDGYSCDYVNNAIKDTYSTSEQVIGKWIDGKPLYEKTIYISALPNNAGTTYNHNISNIGVRFIVNAFWQQTSGTTGPIPMYFEAAQITSCYVSNTGVYIRTNVDYSNRSAYVILRYTKTTD